MHTPHTHTHIHTHTYPTHTHAQNTTITLAQVLRINKYNAVTNTPGSKKIDADTHVCK